MKWLIPLIALASPAFAQSVDWSHGACYENGIYFPAREFNQCVSADKSSYAQTMAPPNMQGVTSGIYSTTITRIVAKCPSDRSLVMVGSGRYKCAKDLTDPE